MIFQEIAINYDPLNREGNRHGTECLLKIFQPNGHLTDPLEITSQVGWWWLDCYFAIFKITDFVRCLSWVCLVADHLLFEMYLNRIVLSHVCSSAREYVMVVSLHSLYISFDAPFMHHNTDWHWSHPQLKVKVSSWLLSLITKQSDLQIYGHCTALNFIELQHFIIFNNQHLYLRSPGKLAMKCKIYRSLT